MRSIFHVKYLFFSAAIIFFFQGPGKCMEEDVTPSEIPKNSTLLQPPKIVKDYENDLRSVAEFVKQRKENNQPVKLILGARNSLKEDQVSDDNINPDRFKFFYDGSWIFWDRGEHDPNGMPYIKGDFNDPLLLQAIRNLAPESIDEIVTDAYTAKFINFENLSSFANLLKNGGKFLCSVDKRQCFISYDFIRDKDGQIIQIVDDEELMNYFFKEKTNSPSWLSFNFRVPFPDSIGFTPEEKKAWQKAALNQRLNSPKEAWHLRQQWTDKRTIILKEKSYKRMVAEITNHFRKYFDVVEVKDTAYPVPSNHHKDGETAMLLTAQKLKRDS